MRAGLAALERWSFGDSPAMADELLALVLEGKKTATCGAHASYERNGTPVQKPGERSIILDGAGRDACLIETVEVTIRHLDEIDEGFARDEGEDDRTLASWRDGHRRYFTREGTFAPDMKLVCERFRVMTIFPREAGL